MKITLIATRASRRLSRTFEGFGRTFLITLILHLATSELKAVQTVTTNLGAGADVFVGGGTNADTNFNADPNGQIWVQRADTLDGSRKGYVRFDTSNIIGPAQDVTLTLHVRIDNAIRVHVYGLNDGASGDGSSGWGEGTITWNNAPANDTGSSDGVTAAATLLGTFDMVDTADHSSGPYLFSSNGLRDFINGDTNGSVTLILAGSASIGGDGGLSVGFRTKEFDLNLAPELSIEPSPISIHTSVGAGADVFVGGGVNADTNYNNDPNGQIWVQRASTLDGSRKGYIRFDRSSAPDVMDAVHLVLNVRIDNAIRVHVYGLNDGVSGDGSGGWGETTITWNNAPANGTASSDGFTSNATLLGTFDMVDTADHSSGPYVFSSEDNPAFVTFVNADTNNLLTMMLAGSASIGGDGGLSVGFRTKEFDVNLSPELILMPLVEAPGPEVIVTTANNGADVFIGGGTNADTNFDNDANGQIWVQRASTLDGSRKGYLRFDVSGVAPTFERAELVLRVRIDNAIRVHVYGLNDGLAADSATGWAEGSITWNNAPANQANSSDGFTTDATLLGTFDMTDTSNNSSGPYVFSSDASPALLDFIANDTNGYVTLLLAGSDSIGGDGGLSVGFRTKEYDANHAPQLRINADPFTGGGRCDEPWPSGINLADKGLSEGDVINGFLSTWVADNTTVIIPPGTYIFNASLSLSHNNYTIIAPDGAVFDIVGVRTLTLRGNDWRFSGIVFDQRGDNTQVMLNTGGNRWQVDNCSWWGIHEGGQRLMIPYVTTQGQTALVDQIYMGDGQVEGSSTGGIWVNANAPHNGTLTFRRAYIAHMVDNGLYGSGPPTQGAPGVTHVDNSFFHANTISNARTGALDGQVCVVKDSKFLLDCTNPACGEGCSSPGSKTTRAVWAWYGEVRVENCDFKVDCGSTFATSKGGTITEVNNRHGTAANMSVQAGIPTSATAILCY